MEKFDGVRLEIKGEKKKEKINLQVIKIFGKAKHIAFSIQPQNVLLYFVSFYLTSTAEKAQVKSSMLNKLPSLSLSLSLCSFGGHEQQKPEDL